MKNILIGIFALGLLTGCNTEVSDKPVDEVLLENEKPKEELSENLYRLHVKENKINTKQVWAFQYKFGEPQKEGLLVYETNYDSQGNLLDSVVYNSNKVSFHEKYSYNDKNELIVRKLIDSSGTEVQRSERLFNEKGLESGFVMFIGDSIYYQQNREYNEKDELIRLKESDARGGANGVSKLISEFDYTDKGELLNKTELDNNENILSRISYRYDTKGNKVSISNYNSTGNLQGKTLLKEYESGNAKLIEKYDAFDSLYASYQYEYDKNGEETKSIIFNGVGQVIRQANTTIDDKGNKVLFEIYEGEVGFLGKDEVKYNEDGQEIELIVYDGQNKQVKRKLTIYNERGLVIKEENYNKIDEPIYQFKYIYTHF